jgi:class 3 adenylate cyclase/pSer/pThr/pTyr-binding forkhead associated (FHA) protein
MWFLKITSPKSKPLQIKLTPGKMVIGRMTSNDILVDDDAASRRHAEIFFDPLTEMLRINDLGSSNGTYVNRQRISGYFRLHDRDVIRIGQTELQLVNIDSPDAVWKETSGTSMLTREMVLEAVDEHPILLNELTEQLNTVVDADSANSLLIEMIKRSLGVDVCEIIPAADFKKKKLENPDNLMARTIQKSTIETSPLALCVPVIGGGKPYALIYMERNHVEARPFDKRETQLAIGISHQAALTMQRLELLDKIRKEGQARHLLLRFVSPLEVESILVDYFETGSLPDLVEKKVTVLFTEISDSSGLAELMGSKKYLFHLKSFHQFVTQSVFKHGGMAKYLGDGVLAFFMDTQDKLGHEERAAIVAGEVVEYLKRTLSSEPNQACEAGIAINTGKALVGYVGTQERAEFNVLGNMIKETFRIQEHTLPNHVLIGALTAAAIRNKYSVAKNDSLTMNWSKQPVEVYELSFVKTAPFVSSEGYNDMPAAFKAIAEKLRNLGK